MDYSKQMQDVVNGFVSQVTELAKRAAVEAISKSMGIAPRSTSAALTRTNIGTLGGRGKRDVEQMDAMKTKLLRLIADNQGVSSERINSLLGTTTKQIALPLRQLVADKLVTTKGERRGMRYFTGKTAKH
jgi:predicted HTH transcriptional regulator